MKKHGIWKKALSLSLAAALLTPAALAKVPVDESQIAPEALEYAYWDTSLSDEERAADLISHMTLEEKASQLGSHPAAAIPRLGVAEYWYPGENLNGIANISLWYGSEAGDAESAASAFPSTLAQGSTWNTDLISQMADAIGDEARAFYNTSNKGLSHWGPSVNLARDPRWGRTGDSFTEDAMLSGVLGSAFVRGFQGELDDEDYLKAIACLKHFAANNAEETRHGGSSNMSEAELREYYLRHFETMVEDSDPASVMAAYSAINGIPSHANYTLLHDILEETWGFNGWVVSDNTGVENLYNYYSETGTNGTDPERTDRENFPVLDGGEEDYNGLTTPDVNSMVEGVATAMQAGVDLDLKAGGATETGNAYQYYLVEAVNQGLLRESDLDAALLDIFTTRFATGEFDNTDAYTEGYQSEAAFIQEHQDLAEDVAEQAIVLLKNEDSILPANIGDYDRVLVVGQYIDELLYSDYKSNEGWRVENGIDVSFVEGIQAAVDAYNTVNSDNVTVETAVLVENAETGNVTLPDDGQGGQMWNRMLTDSKTLTIYIPATRIGMMDGSADAGEANDRDSLDLPRGQAELGADLANRCANLVVALHTQSIVNLDWAEGAEAILWASYLGEKQGTALANVLFGQTSPSGRLTTTWYADESQLGELQHDYSIYPSEENPYGRTYMYFTGDVAYPFGYGLSYATFAYSDFQIDKTADVTGNDTVNVTVTVENTSDTDAYEVVELYAVGPNAEQANRADKQLAAFAKVFVAAGESETVTLPVDMFDLSVWDEEQNCFTLETGDWTFYLGSDCETRIEGCEGTVSVTADITPALKNVTLNPSAYILPVDGTATVETSVSLTNDALYQDTLPEGVTLSFASSDPAVAAVDAATGSITAAGLGVCTITVTASMGEQTVTETHPVVVSADAVQESPFTDVPATAWFADSVAYVQANGLMNGTSATTFSPDVNTTRGMVVTMLYRLAGSPDVSGTELSFTDVAADSYCADAVAWASANDIVSGYSETTFGPDDSVTRDQLATILYRYAVSQGMDVTGGVELTAYTDADQVPAYSLEAMQWAVGTGLITGRSETTVAPLGTASRAEVATIFARFCQNNEG